MSWRCRAKQEEVCAGSAARSGAHGSSLPASAAPGTSTARPWGAAAGLGSRMGLPCCPVTSWMLCMAGAATAELRGWLSPCCARSNLRLRWFPVLALQGLVRTRAGFLHP